MIGFLSSRFILTFLLQGAVKIRTKNVSLKKLFITSNKDTKNAFISHLRNPFLDLLFNIANLRLYHPLVLKCEHAVFKWSRFMVANAASMVRKETSGESTHTTRDTYMSVRDGAHVCASCLSAWIPGLPSSTTTLGCVDLLVCFSTTLHMYVE